MSKDTCKTYDNFKTDAECINWLERGTIEANNQYLQTLSEFCIGDNLKNIDCIDNCSKKIPNATETICAKSIIEYCEEKNKYFPLDPILADDICYSFCSTTQDTSLKSRCDSSISKSCKLVYPQEGSSNSNCDCFYEQTTKIGKENLDSENVEPEIRNLGVVCVLSSCRGSGYKTEPLKESAKNCPPCVQLNGINRGIGGVSNVTQTNVCTVITETTAGGDNTTTSDGNNKTETGGSNTTNVGSSTLNLDGLSSITPNILNISIVTGVFFVTVCLVSLYVAFYDQKSSPTLKFVEVAGILTVWVLITIILYYNDIFIIKNLDPNKIIGGIDSIANINNDNPEINNNCPAGFYCPSGEMSSAKECKIGSYCKAGSSSEMNCPSGFYCSIPSKKVICPKGYYCKEEKLTSLKETDKCPIGYYCGKGGNWPPVLCHPGYYCKTGGMSSEIECPIGYYCPTGANSTPILCPKGYYCDKQGISSLGSIYKCPAGSYCPIGGNSKPIICPSGSYCPLGSSSSKLCDIGYYQPEKGKGSCIICPAGSYCPSGSKLNILCDAGYYQSEQGKGSCIICPAGQYCGNLNDNNGKGTVKPASPDGIYTSWEAGYYYNNAYVKDNGSVLQDVKFCPAGAGWPNFYTGTGTNGRSYLYGSPTNPTWCTSWLPEAIKNLR